MLLDLFLCFVQVGLFSIGGGYAAMPMIQAKAVEYYHWLTMGEFTDLMTIAEMTPGPITVNSATFVGIRMAGIPGALVATMGCILPSLIIVSLLSWLYEKYRSMDAMQAVLACLRPAVVALIASAALTILRVVVFAGGVVSAEAVQMLYVALFAAALVVLRVKHSNPILVMVCCGAVSLAAKLIFLALALPGLLFLLSQGFVLLPGLGLPLPEGDLFLLLHLPPGVALLFGAGLIPADEPDDHQDKGDQQQQADVDVPQHGVHAGDKGHEGGELHSAHGDHVDGAIVLPGVDDGDGAQYVPGFNGRRGRVALQVEAELQALWVIGAGQASLGCQNRSGE